MGVPAETAGGVGVVCGGEGPLRHAAGGGERTGARPAPVRGAGRARYLECGVLAHGFARVRCESCKDELPVAFSCKGRGVCPPATRSARM
ncbi:transposase zinc-binding domain-containing protein [Cystobacter fuscus]